MTDSKGSAIAQSSYSIVSIVGIVAAVILAGVSIYNVYILNKATATRNGKASTNTNLTTSEAKAGRIISVVSIVLGLVLAAFIIYEYMKPSRVSTIEGLKEAIGQSSLENRQVQDLINASAAASHGVSTGVGNSPFAM